MGIIDEFGIDSFMTLEGNYKQAFLFFSRSKFQRNAVFFCIDFTDFKRLPAKPYFSWFTISIKST